MKILANDGISPSGVTALKEAGFEIITNNVPQEELVSYINENEVVGLLVRSATVVRKDIIDNCPSLKLIGRGGVGMDNIDVDYARSKGLSVINTPAASSQSVAEMVMGNLFTLARNLHDSNRNMPTNGATEFKALKKKYAKGSELRGKTLGIIGFGRIGQALAQYGLGCGMKVEFYDRSLEEAVIPLYIENYGTIEVQLKRTEFDTLLNDADFLSLHVPAQANGEAVIGEAEIAKMKDGAFIVNSARGGSVDETALASALENGKLGGAALDVFVNEPTPNADLLKVEKLALTPHIGAATSEAQDRIGTELASQIKELLAVYQD
jgi:D-3-phosphoglycerate dehydrogenase